MAYEANARGGPSRSFSIAPNPFKCGSSSMGDMVIKSISTESMRTLQQSGAALAAEDCERCFLGHDPSRGAKVWEKP